MRFDIHLRKDVKNQISNIVESICTWNATDSILDKEVEKLSESVVSFDHCAIPDHSFVIVASDGSGDFPCVTYGDSFIYLVTAVARLYETCSEGILKEKFVHEHSLVDFVWMPEDKKQSNKQLDDCFERLLGLSLSDVCKKSDYYSLAKQLGYCKLSSPEELVSTIIHPEAHDSNNIGIQIRTVAELAELVKIINNNYFNTENCYILEDSTLSLPLLPSSTSLFFEILKRYLAVLAREKNMVYLTISKSHDMPHMDIIEEILSKKMPSTEHWFMRIPTKSEDKDIPSFLGARSIPPVGAISYLFKFHKTTQTMRLDMDYAYWKDKIWNKNKSIMRQHEIQIFRDLDFASHDQRCYGYPYPIKACHDMASLTQAERVSLRKQIIDAAIEKGLKRKNFIDPGMQTGHK